LSEPKWCPLTKESCRGEACALWISVGKPLENPFYEPTYKGCGLVVTVPWEIKKKEEEEDCPRTVKCKPYQREIKKKEEEEA